jgi:hypothetical protein
LTIGDFHSPFSTLMKARPFAPLFGEFGKVFDLAGGDAGQSGGVDGFDDAAVVEGATEDLELRLAEYVAEVE